MDTENREEEEEPVCKHQIAVRGELTGWCGTGRPNLSHETAFSSAIVDKEKLIFPVPLTIEAVLRARIFRRDGGQGKHIFPVLLTRRVGNQTVVDPCPAERADRINFSRS